MSELLPPSTTVLERRLAEACSGTDTLPVPIRSLWNPDECAVRLLPWLAWSLSVDDWDPAWDEGAKRAAVKASLPIHKKKGTIGAVREALAALGYGVRVQEWFAQIPCATPYTFRLWLDIEEVGIPKDALQRIVDVVSSTKNLRSHMSEIVPTISTREQTFVAGALGMGIELDIGAPTQYTGENLLLDRLSAICVAAYSLRKIRSSYYGAAIRIRRSQDNAERDIGFTRDGVLDASGILSFVGDGDGFVSAWYDQSKSALHVFQSDHFRQPKIAVAGSINRQGYIPAILSGGTWLCSAPQNVLATGSNALTATGVMSASASTNFDYFSYGSLSPFQARANGIISGHLQWVDHTGDYESAFYPGNDPFIQTGSFSGSTVSGYVNGKYQGERTSGALATPSWSSLYVGSWIDFNRDFTWHGNMMELVFFNETVTEDDRSILEQDQGNFYGINLE